MKDKKISVQTQTKFKGLIASAKNKDWLNHMFKHSKKFLLIMKNTKVIRNIFVIKLGGYILWK